MAQAVRRRAMSSDRAGESMERDDVKRRDRGEDGQKRARPVSLVRTMLCFVSEKFFDPKKYSTCHKIEDRFNPWVCVRDLPPVV